MTATSLIFLIGSIQSDGQSSRDHHRSVPQTAHCCTERAKKHAKRVQIHILLISSIDTNFEFKLMSFEIFKQYIDNNDLAGASAAISQLRLEEIQLDLPFYYAAKLGNSSFVNLFLELNAGMNE